MLEGKVALVAGATRGAGRGIARAGIVLEPEKAMELVAFLRDGSPPIYPRNHLLNLGIVAFDPRPLTDKDAEVIMQRVHDFFVR